ncbi:hypothetical protein [Umezawaea tangerina]|uniref:Trypsin n=1 Tax=Umezawaea tangerina TaxID=84725 RepID=A0A2T0T6Y1_9PSEU|nr:hypothetical protein [Umezawaea tangerina]PRY41401.1 hypothetical protein CLV43_105159 [Umezawaea tangerina]
MRLLRPVLAALAAASLTLAIGAAPANASDPKPDNTGKASGQGVAPADAGRRAPVVSQAVDVASSTIQTRIVDYVKTRGTKYTFGAYADPTSGKVVVETDAPGDVVASLVGSYGTVVDVRKHEVSDIFSRRDDVPAFWGGAGITLTAPSARCSSGYTVQNSAGTRFQVTAGHCFTDGQTAVTELGGLTVGTISGNGLPSQDMELISGQSYGPFIYLGGVDSTTGAHVLSAGDPVVGFTDYCHSGRTTGENCGHTATSVTATVCTSSGCKSPVTAFTGGNLPQGGDSGSPFYVGSVSAPDKHIRGHVIAIGGGTAYAELWSRVAARFGVTIAT